MNLDEKIVIELSGKLYWTTRREKELAELDRITFGTAIWYCGTDEYGHAILARRIPLSEFFERVKP